MNKRLERMPGDEWFREALLDFIETHMQSQGTDGVIYELEAAAQLIEKSERRIMRSDEPNSWTFSRVREEMQTS